MLVNIEGVAQPADANGIREIVPYVYTSQDSRETPSEVRDANHARYIVRRLTPVECERLQGLPDNYTIPVGLDPNDPALVEEFRQIHDEFAAIMAAYEGKKPPKPKTAAQVQKWLAKITDPATCPDSPRYKACGNGWATNQPRWILLRILAHEGIAPWADEDESISISGECRETPRGGEGSWKTAVPPADPVAVTSEDER